MPMSTERQHLDRLGRFRVPHRVMVEASKAELQQLFEGMVILDADSQFDYGGTQYLAYSDRFNPVPEGMVAPMYRVEWDRINGGWLWWAEDGTEISPAR